MTETNTGGRSGPNALRIAAFAVAFAAGVLGWRLLSGRSVDIDAALSKASQELNAKCPMTVDAFTRLDSSMPGPGSRFTYLYTVLGEAAEAARMPEFAAGMRPKLVNMIRTNTDMQSFREHEVTLVYVYRDEAASELLRIEVTPDDYR